MLTTWLKWGRGDNLPVAGPPPPFDLLPDGVVGEIFGRLPLGDRVRTRLVCKSWRDKLVRADFPIKPEPPWLFLPNDSYDKPRCFQSEVLFQSMSEEDQVYRFKMPKSVYPGWWWRWRCCGGGGSQSGWLLMAGRQALGGRTAMMLWDPISGATRKLPALSTLPFFAQLVDDWSRAGVGHKDITSVFTARAQVVFSGVVAVVFVLGRHLEERRLALCSPDDQSWSVFGGEEDKYHEDILFHDGKLYTVHAWGNPDADRSAVVPRTVEKTERTVRLSCCDVEVTMLEIKYGGRLVHNLHPLSYNTCSRWRLSNHLVGSATADGDGLLIVSTVLHLSTYSCGVGCQGPVRSHACSHTGGFEVRRLRENKLQLGSWDLEKLTTIGEQCIFLGGCGSTSIGARVEEEAGCIHFAIDDANGTHGIDDENYDDDDFQFIPENFYAVHERGVFYVPHDMIETTCLTNLRIQSGSCAGWFTPKLPSSLQFAS